MASFKGHDKVVRFILEKSDPKSFDINKKNNFGETAEDMARRKGHKSVLELFEIFRLESEIQEKMSRLQILKTILMKRILLFNFLIVIFILFIIND